MGARSRSRQHCNTISSNSHYGNTANDSSTYFTSGGLSIIGGTGATNYASGPLDHAGSNH